jgi:hypothetical protein
MLTARPCTSADALDGDDADAALASDADEEDEDDDASATAFVSSDDVDEALGDVAAVLEQLRAVHSDAELVAAARVLPQRIRSFLAYAALVSGAADPSATALIHVLRQPDANIRHAHCVAMRPAATCVRLC